VEQLCEKNLLGHTFTITNFYKGDLPPVSTNKDVVTTPSLCCLFAVIFTLILREGQCFLMKVGYASNLLMISVEPTGTEIPLSDRSNEVCVSSATK